MHTGKGFLSREPTLDLALSVVCGSRSQAHGSGFRFDGDELDAQLDVGFRVQASDSRGKGS